MLYSPGPWPYPKTLGKAVKARQGIFVYSMSDEETYFYQISIDQLPVSATKVATWVLDILVLGLKICSSIFLPIKNSMSL